MTDPLADPLRLLYETDRPLFGDTGLNPVGWMSHNADLRTTR